MLDQLSSIATNQQTEKASHSDISYLRIFLNKGKPSRMYWKIPLTSNQHSSDEADFMTITFGPATESLPQLHQQSEAETFATSIPMWQQIEELVERCYQSVPMDHLALSVCIDSEQGIRLLMLEHHFEIPNRSLH